MYRATFFGDFGVSRSLGDGLLLMVCRRGAIREPMKQKRWVIEPFSRVWRAQWSTNTN